MQGRTQFQAPTTNFGVMQQAMGFTSNNFAAKPKLVNRAGPMAAGGGKLGHTTDYFSAGAMSTAMTRDPYRDFV